MGDKQIGFASEKIRTHVSTVGSPILSSIALSAQLALIPGAYIYSPVTMVAYAGVAIIAICSILSYAFSPNPTIAINKSITKLFDDTLPFLFFLQGKLIIIKEINIIITENLEKKDYDDLFKGAYTETIDKINTTCCNILAYYKTAVKTALDWFFDDAVITKAMTEMNVLNSLAITYITLSNDIVKKLTVTHVDLAPKIDEFYKGDSFLFYSDYRAFQLKVVAGDANAEEVAKEKDMYVDAAEKVFNYLEGDTKLNREVTELVVSDIKEEALEEAKEDRDRSKLLNTSSKEIVSELLQQDMDSNKNNPSYLQKDVNINKNISYLQQGGTNINGGKLATLYNKIYNKFIANRQYLFNPVKRKYIKSKRNGKKTLGKKTLGKKTLGKKTLGKKTLGKKTKKHKVKKSNRLKTI